jgi:hypothetical protein
MKRFFILALVMSNILPMLAQKTILLPSGQIVDSVMPAMPIRTVENVSDGVIVTYEFDKLKLGVDADFNNSSILKLDGFGQNMSPGEPSFPAHWDNFIIPNSTSSIITVLDSTFVELPMELAPARRPLLINEEQSADTTIMIIPYDGFFPHSIIEKGGIEKYRGQPIQNICICPVQYNYVHQMVRLYTRISYKISYVNVRESEALAEKKISRNDYYLHDKMLNGEPLGSCLSNTRNVSSQEATTEDYLIISVPEYSSAAEKFAKWKRTLGFNVHVAINNSWTSSSIKNKIQEVYDESDALYYVLFLGGHYQIPSELHTSIIPSLPPLSHYTDMYYFCMDGTSDSIPDIFHGRIPVNNVTDANTVVDKIISYEKEPVQDANFYNTGVNGAFFEKDSTNVGHEKLRFVETSEEIRNYLNNHGKNIHRVYYSTENNPTNWSIRYSDGAPIPNELRKPTFLWNGEGTDITNYINSGAFYVMYNGHGSPPEWASYNPVFGWGNILNMTNQNKLPVVFSISCSTGNFTYPLLGCLAQYFLRQSGGGSHAVFANTSDSFAGFGDAYAAGMINAFWPNPGLLPKYVEQGGGQYPATERPVYELGKAMEYGLTSMMQTWSSHLPICGKYNRELAHCFGDPSMRMYTMQPTPFTGVETSKSSNIYMVRLLNDSARISFYDKSTGEVVSYTGNIATYNNMNDSVIVCISAPNKIPYIISDNHADNIYIQNESITQTNTYQGNTIKVGSSVTDMKPTGPVVFNGGHIILTGGDVEIQGETTIQQGTTFEINSQ